ncbi:MAG: Gfo/Idh/MocA family oxidoreductase [Lachnospiraceae bacterium]|nr:Gfo/Idh/MocA family oxidoreductase [Lachnospiraceae bacterium]
MKKIRIGLIGTGFAASLHMEAFRRIPGYEVEIAGVSGRNLEKAKDFAAKYQIRRVYDSWIDMLADPQLDVIDVCTTPSSHMEMVTAALAADKSVICEKPLTGCFDKQKLDLEALELELEALLHAEKKSKGTFFYAENFVYAPAVQKVAEFIRKTGEHILYMTGEESHSGSHAEHAGYWKYNGGGSLIRQGCHPVSALLYLKEQEGETGIRDVMADMGYLVPTLADEQKRYISAKPVDVEDFANMMVTFTDGTKAAVVSGDMILGGVRNKVEVFTTEGSYLCNIAPNTQMNVFHPEQDSLRDIYFTEKVETRAGWQSIFLQEEYARGYISELEDFVKCIAGDKDKPESGLALACDTLRLIYAAYRSSDQGKRMKVENRQEMMI